jgi:N-acetylmuramoyl-L-alanine amidase
VRVWPAQDYTRVTLEHDQPIKFSHMLVRDPERLVVDLEGVEFNSVLSIQPNKILASDPQIKLIRAGRNKPGVVRLVIELKGEVKPQVFTLKPVGEYGHRLVLDLYPAEPPDPLMALLEKGEAPLKAESRIESRDRAQSPADKPEIMRLCDDCARPRSWRRRSAPSVAAAARRRR